MPRPYRTPGQIGSKSGWTTSGYAPYPGSRPFAGAFAEYNGKFTREGIEGLAARAGLAVADV